ncbi:MAG: MFS transporter [Holosporaceae bacterium]|jgi:MHS family proline/betaine transporter-like MFS transporter|nr:MFS transporter [Holosporaceae bacterium]
MKKHSSAAYASSEFTRIKKVILSCIAGSALEWYDFAIYGFFATTIGKLFFPSGDAFQQIIASYGAFASGLIARPMGAVLFGYIGDRYGRKKALVISIYLMAIPTAIMGLLPTYEHIGLWAGVLLTLIRILQGLALGGGFTGTIVFLYEHSSDARKSTYSAWAPFSLVSGFILGALVATLMSSVLNPEQLELFGWRIPFILSFVGTFVAEYVKNRLEDPREFVEQQKMENAKQKQSGSAMLGSLFRLHWRGLALVTVTDVLTACGYFLIAIFFTTYFETVLHLGKQNAFYIQTINMIFFALAILFGGWLADRVGKRLQMVIACISMVIFVYPLFILLEDATFYSALLGQMGIIFIFSMYYGPIPATICSMLPTKVRLTGVSIAHNFAMAAFGAYAPTWATYLIKITGNTASPALLFVAAASMTAVALLSWKEGKEY